MQPFKRILTFLLAPALLFALGACSTPSPATPSASQPQPIPTPPADNGAYEIALITDAGTIEDRSFNQGAWNGVKGFAEANGITYAYYRPAEDTKEARKEMMQNAIAKGAAVIVCPGSSFADAVYEMQTAYPDIQFLLLDGEPHDSDLQTYETTFNTYCILYREEQAGYLAGYAAVMEGYTKLGFLGGKVLTSVIRYGYGFVQGAEAAATELGMAPEAVELNYWYSNSFSPSEEIQKKMEEWYTGGTQVVFSCGGRIYQSCLAAAEASQGKVIGVDVDQSTESVLIITSAVKSLSQSVELALSDLYANEGTWDVWQAGRASVLGVEEDCVGLATDGDAWRLEHFTLEDYQAVYQKLKEGAVTVDSSTDQTIRPTTVIVSVDYLN